MYRFALSDSCKHKLLATYFGDSAKVCEDKCASCVKEPVAQVDISKEAQMFLSAIYRTGAKFGQNHLIDVLRGSEAAKILQFSHEKLSVYGIGKAHAKKVWEMIVDRLYELEALAVGEHRAVIMTQLGVDILKGAMAVEIDEDKLVIERYKKEAEDVYVERDETFESLRTLRSSLATEANVPAYIVFSDKTLQDMSQKLPQNKEEMLDVHGIGEVKFERYGEAFLELCEELATSV
jgi:ATP-dependent DNA helicase RecQ